MVRQVRLNDAAMTLYLVLSEANVKHGVFGGFAIETLGGPRETKDIDCIASATKSQIISLLDGKRGFQFVNQTRPDYVAFLWSESPDRSNAVLVEIFVEQFEGSQFCMQNVQPEVHQVTGQGHIAGPISLLDPVYVFKGKLSAAAARNKFHDSADLRWLEKNFSGKLRARKNELNFLDVIPAIKRYPELEMAFNRIGIDIDAAKGASDAVDLDRLPPVPRRGDVQKGILC